MTVRLVAILRSNWVEIDGLCASQGFDPLDLAFPRLLNLAYWWITRNADGSEESQTALRDLDLKLWLPPVGVEVPQESPWSAEAEEAAFGSFVGQFEAL